jgi:hypothetical protein
MDFASAERSGHYRIGGGGIKPNFGLPHEWVQ